MEKTKPVRSERLLKDEDGKMQRSGPFLVGFVEVSGVGFNKKDFF